jgi:hypothetical protein
MGTGDKVYFAEKSRRRMSVDSSANGSHKGPYMALCRILEGESKAVFASFINVVYIVS